MSQHHGSAKQESSPISARQAGCARKKIYTAAGDRSKDHRFGRLGRNGGGTQIRDHPTSCYNGTLLSLSASPLLRQSAADHTGPARPTLSVHLRAQVKPPSHDQPNQGRNRVAGGFFQSAFDAECAEITQRRLRMPSTRRSAGRRPSHSRLAISRNNRYEGANRIDDPVMTTKSL